MHPEMLRNDLLAAGHTSQRTLEDAFEHRVFGHQANAYLHLGQLRTLVDHQLIAEQLTGEI
ncbi:hypothetical protein D3C81_1821760 [compost metagenome]